VYAADKKGDEVGVFDLFIRKNILFRALYGICRTGDRSYNSSRPSLQRRRYQLLKEKHPEMTDAFHD
jgi:hypothetical protein